MSYILDALKKLEHEKNRKSRGSGMINISGSLFEQEHFRDSGTSGRKTVFFVILAVLVTFGASWLLLRPVQKREKAVSRPPVATSAVAPLTSKAVSAAPVQAVAPVQPVLLTTVPVAREKTSPAAPPAKSTKPQPAGNVKKLPVSDDAAAVLTMQELRRRMKERKGQGMSPDQTIPAPADIMLSGIAWQDERRARRAVVNGFLMQEGGVVAGARITDIYQDRVRFSLSGKAFEITLVSSAVSTVVK